VNGSPTERGLIARFAAQLGRFGLVGVANTLVDLLATNLLYAFWPATSPTGLTAISVIAGILATVHSYVLNSRWTFRGEASERGTAWRFVAFALLGLATQAAVTLSVAHWMLSDGRVASLAVLNAAKLAAVVAAAGVTFIGYRVAVFTPRALADFRETFVMAGERPSAATLLALALLSLAVRLAFLAAAPVAYGDAVNYSWDAWFLGHGMAGQADPFWHSAFDYWQALLVPFGLDQFGTLVLASLIPGTLLVVPVYLIAARLHGRRAAAIAGLVVAVHPRLVEYAVNGYAESFFLCVATFAVWALTRWLHEPRRLGAAALAGAMLALWFLVRNEAILACAALVAVTGLAFLRSRRRPSLAACLALLIAGAMGVGAYAVADRSYFGQVHLFSKGSNLSRQHVEMLEPQAAARETYSNPGVAKAHAPVTAKETLQHVLGRWPQNVVYTLERIPGVLLSPLFLVALLLPALARRRGDMPEAAWPLLAFTLWPVAFYPLLQLEPRMLLPVAIGTAIFGAAALVALGEFLAGTLARPMLRTLPAGLTIAALLPLLPIVAAHTNDERAFHRTVGAWLHAHVDPRTPISGDGYGFVTTSAFWAGRRAEPRIWASDPATLGEWALAHGPRVIVVYERYLREFNPELLPVLDGGIPGLARRASFTVEGAGHIVVYATPAS
jgi:putative flippase GtrA